MFNEKQRNSRSTSIKTITIIPSMTVCWFGGQRLEFDSINRTFGIDGAIRFNVNDQITNIFFYTRDVIDELFNNTVENPKTAGMTHEEGRRVGDLLNIIITG